MPTSNECCSNGFRNWKINIATNTATVTKMIEATVPYQRNMLSEIKITIKCKAKIIYMSDGLIRDVRREETSKLAALSGLS